MLLWGEVWSLPNLAGASHYPKDEDSIAMCTGSSMYRLSQVSLHAGCQHAPTILNQVSAALLLLTNDHNACATTTTSIGSSCRCCRLLINCCGAGADAGCQLALHSDCCTPGHLQIRWEYSLTSSITTTWMLGKAALRVRFCFGLGQCNSLVASNCFLTTHLACAGH